MAEMGDKTRRWWRRYRSGDHFPKWEQELPAQPGDRRRRQHILFLTALGITFVVLVLICLILYTSI